MKNSAIPTLSFSSVLRFAGNYWIKQPKRFVFILVAILTAALLETSLPTALAWFLNSIQHSNDKSDIIYYLCIFLGAYFLQAVFYSIAYLVYNTFETKLFKSLVDDVFEHIYRLPEQFFLSTFTGSIVSKINRARQKIEIFEDQILIRIFPTAVVLFGSIIFLTIKFPMLGLLLFAYLIILIIVSAYLVFKVSGPAQGVYAHAQDEFSAHLADSISGIATTKSYAQEQYELSQFLEVTAQLRIKNIHAYHLGNIAGLIQRILLSGMLILLMGGGTYYFFHGMASVGSMAYLAFAYMIMQSYIRDVGENIKNLLTSSYDLHGVMQLASEETEVPLLETLPNLIVSRGEIVFDQVEFTYPDKNQPIFKNLSLTIKAGERIALVGHSGGGKTSFIRLLQRLYTVQKGRIFVDDQNIAEGSLFSLRSSMAIVPQDPILFHRSIRENIAYAKPTANEFEIRSAAQNANIEKFILNLPDQYETLVGERGVKLSGGERQRIAIARAILANRPILILDEATSSLDSESERAIQDALHTLTHGRTSILIAHRLSTILDADRIFVFDAGKIVEAGSHEELLKQKNGIYAKLFKLQSGGFIAE